MSIFGHPIKPTTHTDDQPYVIELKKIARKHGLPEPSGSDSMSGFIHNCMQAAMAELGIYKKDNS